MALSWRWTNWRRCSYRFGVRRHSRCVRHQFVGVHLVESLFDLGLRFGFSAPLGRNQLRTRQLIRSRLTGFATVFVTAFLVVLDDVAVVVVEAAFALAARRAGAFSMFFRGDGGLSVAFARARVTGAMVGMET